MSAYSVIWTTVAVSLLSAPPDFNDLTQVRSTFLEVERIARLTEAEQQKHVPRCYELTTFLIPRRYAMAYFMAAPPFDPKHPKTPEERAKEVEAKGGWAGLHSEARQQCLAILKRHTKTLEPLVAADFAAGDDPRVARALAVAGELRLTGSFADVLKVFRGSSPNSERAMYVLRDLNDPRAILPLIQRHPDNPLQYFESLRHLCRKRPAEPALVKLLDAEDAQVRMRATYALSECGDDSLAPTVAKLLADSDAAVRQNAANMAVNLSDAVFAQLRPKLLALFNDPAREVRFYTALFFAHRKDAACAPALLALLREAQLHEGYHSTAVQAVHTLTGSYFGYQLGEKPSTPANQAALEAFAQWIEKQGK